MTETRGRKPTYDWASVNWDRQRDVEICARLGCSKTMASLMRIRITGHAPHFTGAYHTELRERRQEMIRRVEEYRQTHAHANRREIWQAIGGDYASPESMQVAFCNGIRQYRKGRAR